jgi:hypothetical protein
MTASTVVPQLQFDHFLTYEELTDFVRQLASACPGLCRLTSLGDSRDGRPIHLLSITDFSTGDADDKPAYLIQGNIHAAELAGTHTSLYTAQRLLTDAPELLREVVFHIVPRLNPDGAEFAVSTCGRVRSRTQVDQREANALYQEDVNGDGLILSMRQEHPDGPFAVDAQDPRLLVSRRFGSAPPYYRVLPEGMINSWDGSDDIREGGRSFDWNRNWSYDWRPEPEQGGAGDFPFSETEMHHLGSFIHQRPNLFGVLGYHTGPAAVLRPPSTGSDADLDAHDVREIEDLAEMAATATGFPVVPVIKYHDVRSRDINLRGHFHNFGYQHLGLYVFEFELGVMRNSAGLSTPEQFGVRTDEEADALARQMLQWWDQQENREPLFEPWRPFAHPQLGPVEIGGFRHPQLANPALSKLGEIAAGTYCFTLEHARRHPRVLAEDLQVDAVADGIWRVRARIVNRGGFPTHVSNRGRQLRRLRPVVASLRTGEGVELLSRRGAFELGHLAAIRGNAGVEWFVRADPGARAQLEIAGGTGGNTRTEVTFQ